MIEFRGVTKRFPDGTVAVDDLDLQVRDGGITVFVGPSGCGKTTSLRMVNRMIDPTAGTILVNGTDVMKTDAAQLRRGIGYVIQQAGLFPHRTIVDNVATVPLLLGWDKRKARTRAAELMETVGLAPEMAQPLPGQLSGGQQQRVGVARALAADPPVLLMDEPFSAVDPVVRESLQDELLKLQSELGKTIVFVTHDIDEAIKLGDRVAVFRVGRQARPVRRARRAALAPGRRLRRRLRRPRPRLPRAVVPVVEGAAAGRAAHAGGGERTERGLDAGRRPRGAPAGLAPRPLRRGDGRPGRPRARWLALRHERRLAAQRARRGAVVAVRAGRRGRRRRPRGRLGRRGRRARRARDRPARRGGGLGGLALTVGQPAR